MYTIFMNGDVYAWGVHSLSGLGTMCLHDHEFNVPNIQDTPF